MAPLPPVASPGMAVTRTALLESLESLKGQWRQQQESTAALQQEATRLAADGDALSAQQLLEQVTAASPGDAAAWHELARVRLSQEEPAGAAAALLSAIRLEPWRTRHHLLVAELQTRFPGALADAEYLDAICWTGSSRSLAAVSQEIAGESGEATPQQKINLLAAMGKVQDALGLGETIAQGSAVMQAWWNLADLRDAAGNPSGAAEARGFGAFCEKRWAAAAEHFRDALREGINNVSAYRQLAECYASLGDYSQAERVCAEAIERYGRDDALQLDRMDHLTRDGRGRQASGLAADLLGRDPANLLLKMNARLRLPIVYRDEAELEEFHQRFRAGLDEIENELSLATPEEKKAARAAITRWWSNFYLGYQGRDVTDLLARYGRMTHRIMAANYPDFVRPRPVPPLEAGGRLRVGYLSCHFQFHSVTNTTVGYLTHRDRRRFEVFTYHAGTTWNAMSGRIEAVSDQFRRCASCRFSELWRLIARDNLHVLMMPDIGMRPEVDVFGTLRVAPVQCTTWGHPLTSGYPTMDYFVSGGGMEPADGECHYTERLIRLPNLGVRYEHPGNVQQAGSRGQFGIPADAVAYISCQSLQKYLPRYDHLYAEIALGVPQACFVFLQCGVRAVDEIFESRMRNAFATVGLDARRHCLHLPQQDYLNYRRLIEVCDVFLDTVQWSGANTTYEAVASGIPVVAQEGLFMRGRHSSAILRMLGLEEFIAADDKEYVGLAVRLGNSLELRQHLRAIILQRVNAVFEDPTVVPDLEAFYEEAVEAAASQ